MASHRALHGSESGRIANDPAYDAARGVRKIARALLSVSDKTGTNDTPPMRDGGHRLTGDEMIHHVTDTERAQAAEIERLRE